MITMYKEFNKGMVASIILYVVIGVILIIWPETTAKIVNYMIAVALACAGLSFLAKYVKKDILNSSKSFDFSIGVVLISMALYLFLKPTFVASIFPIILGFIIFVSGSVKLQNAIDMARIGYEKWWIMMLMAVIAISGGILILVNPFSTAKILTVIIGAIFVYSGLSDLIATLVVKGKMKEFENKTKNEIIINVDNK